MDNDQTRAELESRRQDLGDRQERIARHTRHRDEPLPPDFAEQAVELENSETLVALDRELSHELAQIEHALRRLDAGTYSNCERCGKPVGERRLNALPYASTCIACANES